MKKVKTVLLVDDSKATNFFNKTILQKTERVEEILVAENGKEALSFLESGITPEIIFLDINMPVMSGWEFLEEYQKLKDLHTNTVVVLMLGAQLSDNDLNIAKNYSFIKGFEGKMLSKEIVESILSTHFECLSCQ